MRRARDEKGFTLIELLIVIIIIGILAAIAIPMYLGQRQRARDSAVKGGVHNIELGIASFAVDHNDIYPTGTGAQAITAATMKDSQGVSYVDNWPKNPWTNVDMKEGTGWGDFHYVSLSSGFSLSGHMSTGDFVVP